MYKKGHIVLVPFPFTDLSGTRVRPAIVLSTSKKSPDLIVVFITSKNKSYSLSKVTITPTRQSGIKVPSIIVCDKIATLDHNIIIGKIGTCEEVILEKIDKELRKIFDL